MGRLPGVIYILYDKVYLFLILEKKEFGNKAECHRLRDFLNGNL